MEGFVDNPRTLFGEELKMLISYKIKKHKDNKSFVTGLKRGLSVIEDCCKTGMFEKYYIRYLCHHLQDDLDCLLIKIKPGMVSPKQTDWNEYNKAHEIQIIIFPLNFISFIAFLSSLIF